MGGLRSNEKSFYLVCFEEKLKLLWLFKVVVVIVVNIVVQKLVAHYSKSTLGISTKLGILAHHDKVQWQGKGYNSESCSFGVMPFFNWIFLSRMMAPERQVSVPHVVFFFSYILWYGNIPNVFLKSLAPYNCGFEFNWELKIFHVMKLFSCFILLINSLCVQG